MPQIINFSELFSSYAFYQLYGGQDPLADPDNIFKTKADMVERIRALVQVLQKMRETPTEDYADGSSILKLG